MSKFFGGPGHPKKRDDKYISIPEFYKEYVKLCKAENIKPYSKKTFNLFHSKLNLEIRNKIIYEGFDWDLPYNLGSIAIYKYKRKLRKKEDGTYNLPINQRRTAELRKTDPNAKPVYFLNSHTGGFKVKIIWRRRENNSIRHLAFYGFATCKPFRYAVTKAVTDPTQRIIDNYLIFEPFNTSNEEY